MTSAQVGQHGITRDQTEQIAATFGTPADALASRQTHRAPEDSWRSAIDEMLRWLSNSEDFELEDRPDGDVLEAAIDFACDQLAEGQPAPSSIIPSGSGRIAMEWNDGRATAIVEFLCLGHAHLTLLHQGKVTNKQVFTRNPKSRKLELRG